MNGAQRIVAERNRQILELGYTVESSEGYTDRQLALAALAYMVPSVFPGNPESQQIAADAWWPWDKHYYNLGPEIRNLEKAGALIAAELDRLLALEPQPAAEQPEEDIF